MEIWNRGDGFLRYDIKFDTEWKDFRLVVDLRKNIK